MTVLRIAAFSDGNKCGNPAGIWIGDDLPSAFRHYVKCRFVGTPPSLWGQLLRFNTATEPLD
jgi:hypothetical protein